MIDRMIDFNDPLAKELGFTEDKFSGYLWVKDKMIFISFIESRQPGKGNLKNLFDTIEAKGYDILVPTPFPRMQKICTIRGMKMYQDGEHEIMLRPEVAERRVGADLSSTQN